VQAPEVFCLVIDWIKVLDAPPAEWTRGCPAREFLLGGSGRRVVRTVALSREPCAGREDIILTFDIERLYDCRMAKQAELLQGTLDLLILRTLELQPLHGVGIADRLEQVTKGVFVVGPGSLFPALHRLADRGWIEGKWGELETGRRAKFYAITAAGRKRLVEEKRNWNRVSIAVNQVLAEES
jgi:PadR family transcriptional regulator, regulatory protein PadR